MNNLKKLKTAMTPLEPYYPEAGKVSPCYIKIVLLEKLREIFDIYNESVPEYSETEINNLFLKLIESTPIETEKNKENYKNDIELPTYHHNRTLYAGKILLNKEKAFRYYKSQNLSTSQSYVYLLGILMRVYNELIHKGEYAPFVDFPEHLVGSYNILCYRSESENDYSTALDICKILYMTGSRYVAEYCFN